MIKKVSIIEFGKRWLRFSKTIPILNSMVKILYRFIYVQEARSLEKTLQAMDSFDEFDANVCPQIPPRENLNCLCDLSDWNDPHFQKILAELGKSAGIIRKDWEYARTVLGLEKLGALKPDAVGLSVGAGHEKLMYYFSNIVQKMIGIDLYDSSKWPCEGDPSVLIDPDTVSPFDYCKVHLEFRRMNGCDLEFDDETFDFAYSLSSIEHFGGHEYAALAMREIERVLKKGGIACIVTEFVINGRAHASYFNRKDMEQFLLRSHGMHLLESKIDFRIGKETIASYIDIEKDSLSRSPHVVLKQLGHLWTSTILFFRKM